MKTTTFIDGLKIDITDNQFLLYNSHLIKSKKEMRTIIEKLKTTFPNHAVSKISTFMLVSEWATHNLFYAFGILRSRTRDTNLNIGKTWYINALYAILGFFYW